MCLTRISWYVFGRGAGWLAVVADSGPQLKNLSLGLLLAPDGSQSCELIPVSEENCCIPPWLLRVQIEKVEHTRQCPLETYRRPLIHQELTSTIIDSSGLTLDVRNYGIQHHFQAQLGFRRYRFRDGLLLRHVCVHCTMFVRPLKSNNSAFNKAVDSWYDKHNAGVSMLLWVPLHSGLIFPTGKWISNHQRLTEQKQWKDIRHRYVTSEEDDE
jgi:hypothetical protein